MKKIFLFLLVIGCMQQSGLAQCYPDRHSTNFFDGWISCEPAMSPNILRGPGHFIMYDFGKVYALGQVRIWNTNDPAHLDWGMKDIVIDYSTDGVHWVEAGQFTFPQASGLSTYEGADGPNLDDAQARYLLITAISNYGGTCYGFSEIKINAEKVILSDVENVVSLDCVDLSVYPNPFTNYVTLNLTPGCSGDLRYALYDALGKMIATEKINVVAGQQKSVELGRDLPAGTYMLYIEHDGKGIQRQIVKMNRS